MIRNFDAECGIPRGRYGNAPKLPGIDQRASGIRAIQILQVEPGLSEKRGAVTARCVQRPAHGFHVTPQDRILTHCGMYPH
jgi:hypothetical protein